MLPMMASPSATVSNPVAISFIFMFGLSFLQSVDF
jgi:hypothetical protein